MELSVQKRVATRWRRRRRAIALGRLSDERLEESLVWMVGSPRTGSTWLMNMLGDSSRVVKVNEPAIGQHLGLFLADVFQQPASRFDPQRATVFDLRADDEHYFFARRYREAWRGPLRALILARMRARVEEVARDGRPIVVIKEPNGSQGAGIIAGSLPRARLLALVRDGRDVVDSQLDAQRPGAWLDDVRRGVELSGRERTAFIEERAWRWRLRVETVLAACEAHAEDRRLVVRYEDLVASTEAELGRVAEWLGLDLDARATAAKHAFSALPEEQRGSGKFTRAATPGLWRESFSASEVELLEGIMGGMLSRLGYA